MKALFLTNEYPPNVYGGAGVHVEYLTMALSKLDNVEVEVRCFGDQTGTDNTLTVKGIGSQESLIPDAPQALKSTINTLLRCIQFNSFPIKADLVHCHTWYSHWGGILAKLLYEIPLVITTHSLEPLRPWKREQLKSGYNLSSWVEKTALEMADLIIAVSSETKKDILNWFDVCPDKIAVVPNGIDTDEFRQVTETDQLQAYAIPPDKPYVLFVGRITRQKGIIHLVNAIKHINKDLGIVLCAGAPDTKEIEKEMSDKVAEIRKSRDNVYWIREMVSKKTLIQLYSHAAIFCCPSIYEPFGIINLEAMACCTPVIASAVGGIKEVVIPGETGILVPLEQETTAPFNPVNSAKFEGDLAAAINQLAADPAGREKMAQAGRRLVLKKYSWDKIAENVLDLYKKITNI